MSGFIQTMTTVEKKEDAEKIARVILEKRLGACVQIAGPVSSHYWWQGKIDSAEEYLCVIKSRAELYPELEAAIKKVHPYEVPEIMAVPVTSLSAEYGKWLEKELAPAS